MLYSAESIKGNEIKKLSDKCQHRGKFVGQMAK